MGLSSNDIIQMPDGTFRLKKSVSPDVLQKTSKKKVAPKPKKIHEQLEFIKLILSQNEIEFVEEHQFCERKFRFDIACPEIMIAIEYEGLAFHRTHHTSSEGFTNNCTKYNMGILSGWRILRYTFLNYKDFENDLKAML